MTSLSYLNENLGNIVLQNENAYFYLSILSNRIEKLRNLNFELKREKNIEKAIDKMKPPIFWKDKPIIKKQLKMWSYKKIYDVVSKLNEIEVKIKRNNTLSIILMKNFIYEILDQEFSNIS